VDHVARVVTASAFHPPVSPLGVAQVTSHPRLRFIEFLGALEYYGYQVPEVDYPTWRDSFQQFIDNGSEEHALSPLYHFVIDDLPSGTKAPELDDTNAAAALEADAEWTNEDLSKGSAVTQELIGKYLGYLCAIGFLEPPKQSGAEKLPEVTLSEEQMATQQYIGGRGRAVEVTVDREYH